MDSEVEVVEETEVWVTIEYPNLECEHTYGPDWIFGGANNLHPGADPRYKPDSYTYYNEDIEELWTTSVHLCMHAALDYFTYLRDEATRGGWKPAIYIWKNGSPMPWTYDPEEDVAEEHRGF